MGTRGAATRERLVDGARELIETHGYSGTGLNQILAVSGAPRGSLYFHFPGGKDELVAAALERAGEEVAALLRTLSEESADLAEYVRRLVGVFAARTEESGFAKGCPLATTALDVAAVNDRVHAVCRRVYASWQAVLADRLAAEGWSPREAEADAWSALSLIEGALLLARATRSTEPLDRAREAAVRLLVRN
ncbi:TetR/AcrR family transcriptional regulator [Thermobifida halotolerans]|uniref:TetR/AcrR family transcriptional regulator n=2 Tax=Thermobifida halotolerans TaxID=483545 RepID=A0A399G735_9ACTN|nr:TetR/AcrR family transcriptional regulator [Thermobifida halotolerans]